MVSEMFGVRIQNDYKRLTANVTYRVSIVDIGQRIGDESFRLRIVNNGLIVATLLTLVGVPAAYVMIRRT